MADIQARREARMRRILENPDDRMKRLLGKGSSDEVKPNGDEGSQIGPKSEDDSTMPVEESVDERLTQNLEGDSFQIRQRRLPDGSTGTALNSTSRSMKSTVKVSPLKSKSTVGPSSLQQTDGSLNANKSSKDAKMMLKHFEFLRIVMCFLVAFVCRKVLSTGYGIFYVQTIFLPFLCLEVGFFLFKHQVLHNVSLPHRSSMLVGLLILCGIRADVLQLYNKLMGYITAASEDFAMYLFAFMMSNVVAT